MLVEGDTSALEETSGLAETSGLDVSLGLGAGDDVSSGEDEADGLGEGEEDGAGDSDEVTVGVWVTAGMAVLSVSEQAAHSRRSDAREPSKSAFLNIVSSNDILRGGYSAVCIATNRQTAPL